MERTTMKRKLSKELIQTVQKRNYRLAKFWEELGLDVEIVGDMETPAVVKDSYCLACYVHNFYLIFTDTYDRGNEVYRVKLHSVFEYDTDKIIEWLKNSTHRKIYRIRMKEHPKLYVSGYSMKDKKSTDKQKYPVFGKYSAKVFFTDQYAKDIIDIYQLEYCEVV
ncbi:MAG: hypothetical protein JNM95_06125 [Chitinophagaceae bacterium]|nr:hypothetical protein [Chitinophagaceae bacterium]